MSLNKQLKVTKMNSFTSILTVVIYSILGVAALEASSIISVSVASTVIVSMVASAALLQVSILAASKIKENPDNSFANVSYEMKSMLCGMSSVLIFGISALSLAYGILI